MQLRIKHIGDFLEYTFLLLVIACQWENGNWKLHFELFYKIYTKRFKIIVPILIKYLVNCTN